MLYQIDTIHDIFYHDPTKKTDRVLGQVSVFVKAKDETKRKLPSPFMIRTIERLVRSRHCRYLWKLLDEEQYGG